MRAARFTVRGTDRGVSFAEVADIAYHGARLPADGSLDPGLEVTEFYDPPDTNDPQAMHLAVVDRRSRDRRRARSRDYLRAPTIAAWSSIR